MRLRPALVLALALGLTAPLVAHADLGLPTADPTVHAARDTEAIILHGSDIPAWAAPGNVTAKLPFTDLTCVQATGATCNHNNYVKPEVDTANLPDPVEAQMGPVRAQLTAAHPGVDVTKLSGWRWDGTQFVERPFQVDQVFTRYLDNANSGFAVYSGQDQHTTYQFDREGFRWTADDLNKPCYAKPASPVALDPVPTLDTDDEMAFMAADTGGQAPLTGKLPAGVTGTEEAGVTDPLTMKTTYFYIMLGREPGFNADTGYVHYVRDANANKFEKSQSSYSNYGNAAVGPICDANDQPIRTPERRRPKDTATITTDRYTYRYDGRWLMTNIQIKKKDGTWGKDLVDRWKARAFQQDSESNTPCCGYEEEDTNWGGSSTLMGERSGPVRTIRETWGADSGTNVVRRETFYRNEMTMKSWLRVHVIPPLDGIYAQWDYNAGVMNKFRSSYKPDGVTIDGKNDDAFGNMDDPCNPKYSANDTGTATQTYRSVYKQAGLCSAPGGYHLSMDLADPTFGGMNAALQWGETSGDEGTIVDRYTQGARDVTPGGLAQSIVTAQPYYRDDSCFDDATGSDPGPRLLLRSDFEQTTYNGLPRKCWKPTDGAPNGDPKYYQGDIGTHGVHLLFLVDSDNARQQVPIDEIVVEQRQVFLPGDAGNVGEKYGRGMEKPLVARVIAVNNK